MKPLLLLAAFWIGMSILMLSALAAKPSFEDEIQSAQQELGGAEIQGIFGTLIGNQRINIHIGISDAEEITFGIITKDKKVKTVAIAEVKDSTLEVYTTVQTVQKVLRAQNPVAQLKRSLSGKEVTYTVSGVVNKAKFSLLVPLFKWFGPTPEEGEESAVEEDAGDALSENETDTSESIEAESAEVVGEPDSEAGVGDNEINESSESASPSKEGEQVYTLGLVGIGFPLKDITIKVGDTVEWKNERAGLRYDKAMILGTRICAKMKSSLYGPGDSYSWKFDQKGTCLVVDGVYTTEMMKVLVE